MLVSLKMQTCSLCFSCLVSSDSLLFLSIQSFSKIGTPPQAVSQNALNSQMGDPLRGQKGIKSILSQELNQIQPGVPHERAYSQMLGLAMSIVCQTN